MASPPKIAFRQALMMAFTVVALFLLVTAAICLAENERTTMSEDVPDQTFTFVGSYVPIEKTGEILALGQEENGQLFWQFYNGAENLRGFVEKTDDPNLYLLLDGNRSELGLVHVAWSEGVEKGFVYLQMGEEAFRRMNKIAPVPVYRHLE